MTERCTQLEIELAVTRACSPDQAGLESSLKAAVRGMVDKQVAAHTGGLHSPSSHAACSQHRRRKSSSPSKHQRTTCQRSSESAKPERTCQRSSESAKPERTCQRSSESAVPVVGSRGREASSAVASGRSSRASAGVSLVLASDEHDALGSSDDEAGRLTQLANKRSSRGL